MSRRTDLLSSIVIAIISALTLFWLIPTHTSPPQSEGNLSPAFLPSVAAATVLGLALLLGLTSLLSRSHVSEGEHEEFGREARGIGLREFCDLLIWCGFASAMMIGFVAVGFLATAVPALVALMIYAGQRNLLAIASISILVPLAIQQVSWHAFSVQMP